MGLNLDPEAKKSQVMALAKRMLDAGYIDEKDLENLTRISKDRDMGVEDLTGELQTSVLVALQKATGTPTPAPAPAPAPKEDDEFFLTSAAKSSPLPAGAQEALEKGDLKGALSAFRGTGRLSWVGRVLTKAIGNTKVVVVEGLKDADGKPVDGKYSPSEDTIYIRAGAGMNAHTLLHEVTHAVTHHILANPSHPVARQLQKLFEEVRPFLDTAYGAQSLDEFVAETFGNQEFARQLAGIPIGPVSAFRRFVTAVGNFLRAMAGRATVPLNAQTAADALIEQIVSPAPSRLDAPALYLPSAMGSAKQFLSDMDQRIINLPVMGNTWAARFYDLFRYKTPSVARKTLLSSLPLPAFTEVAAKVLPMAPKLDQIEKLQNGETAINRERVEATMKNLTNWKKATPDKVSLLNDIVAFSTLNQVDPSKPRSYYLLPENQYNKEGELRVVLWDKMQDDWNKLGSGQAIYKQMRDSYQNDYEKILGLVSARVNALVPDEQERKKIRDNIYKRLALRGRIEPYFPLTRQGAHWLKYIADGEVYISSFESTVERSQFINYLNEQKANGASISDIEPFAKLNDKVFRNSPPASFVNDILTRMDKIKAGADPQTKDLVNGAIEDVMKAFVATLPESSFAQAFQNRKGTKGFLPDAVDAFYTKSMSLAHQVANMKYSAELYKLREDAKTYLAKNDSEIGREFQGVFNSHIETILNPNIHPYAKALTSVGFNWTLGLNVSSALINFSQIPLVVMPYLGGKYGYSQTSRAVAKATKLFLNSGTTRTVQMTVPEKDAADKDTKTDIQMRAMYSLDNYDFSKPDLPEEIAELKELSDAARESGLLARSMASDVLDMENQRSVLSRINNITGFTFHHGERMNRQISLISAYLLELGRLKKEGGVVDSDARTAAAREAIRLTELTNGGASASSAPLIAKNSLGKVMLMYKRYGLSMYYMLLKTAREAAKSEDKDVRKAAMRQIAGIYTMAGVMAGVQGLPMAGMLFAVYNLFKDDDEDDAETAARKYLGEGVYNGAVNYFTGLGVAGRIGLTDLLIQDTGYKDEENAMLSFMKLMGGPVFGVGDRIARGVKLIHQGDVEKGLEQVLPAGISNGLKSFRYAGEGARTLRGDPILEDISAWNVGAQFFGFAPAEYLRQIEENAVLKGKERAVVKEKTELLRKYYISSRLGDGPAANELMQQIVDFNQRHPTIAIRPETIQRSMRQHMNTSAMMYHGVTLNKQLRPELMRDIAEYGDEED